MKRRMRIAALLCAFAMIFCGLAMPKSAEAANRNIDVFFNGYGGIMTMMVLGDNGPEPWENDFIGLMSDVGQAAGIEAQSLSDPVFWTEREFLGWKVYETFDNGDGTFGQKLLSDQLMTSAEALAFVIPTTMTGEQVLFEAQWEGEYFDYYGDVYFNAYGGTFSLEEWVGTGPTTGEWQVNEYEEYVFWDMKRVSDYTIQMHMEDYYGINMEGTPKKAGATFEGWLEFKAVPSGESFTYEMVPNALFTTEQVLAKTLPAGVNMVYVAKWSDMDLKDYGVEARTEIQDGLQEVPGAVQEQYPTVEKVKDALLEAALKDETFAKEDAKAVYMDVTLQAFDAESGAFVDVTPENFPAAGVTVTLPYPAGTTASGYDFKVMHMISSGAKAGTVEELTPVEAEDGLQVKFTSMSPVAIVYQPASQIEAGGSPEAGDFGMVHYALFMVGISVVGFMIYESRAKRFHR